MADFKLDFSYWAYQTVAMMLTCFLIPRLTVRGPIPAFFTVLVLAFVNSHWWSASLFLNIPNDVTWHTVTLLIANGIIFWIIVKLLPGIDIDGILPAILAPVVFTVCGLLINQYGSKIDWPAVGHYVEAQVTGARSYLESSSASGFVDQASSSSSLSTSEIEP